MITRASLPSGYIAYPKLTLCSNTMIGGGHLLEVRGKLPILIGKGPVPQIWLQVPTNQNATEFAVIVTASVSTHPAIVVSESESAVTVTAAGQQVLRIYSPSPDEAVVDQLDLRPLGYNVFGDSKELNAGGMRLSRNTATGAQVLIALGGA
jgi:hypothetical protein